jgi:Domain of unknown function (DUF4395)
MPPKSIANFMRQQGFPGEPAQMCGSHFKGLLFQPSIMSTLVLVAILVQSAPLFLVLSAVLWWNVAVPPLNPFEATYNALVAKWSGAVVLTAAPAPRRFAQGMAATFMLATSVSLVQGWNVAAWTFEALLVVAFSVLLFGRFCLGAYVFHTLTGRAGFANATLPWASGRPEPS